MRRHPEDSLGKGGVQVNEGAIRITNLTTEHGQHVRVLREMRQDAKFNLTLIPRAQDMTLIGYPPSLEVFGELAVFWLRQNVRVTCSEPSSNNSSGPKRSVNPPVERPSIDEIRDSINESILEFVDFAE